MASWKILVALAIFAVAFPSTLATNWTVGDSAGWDLRVNYVEWAAGKTFVTGDKLVFNYNPESHNVINVSLSDYVSCTIPVGAVPLITGKDEILLQTSGNYSYICGISNHCTLGMRLLITVGEGSPGPAAPPTSGGGITVLPPPPSSTATGIIASWKCHAWVVGVFSILMMIMA